MDQVDDRLCHPHQARANPLDSIGNAQREIDFFFPHFNFQVDLKNNRFDQFTFNKHTLEHQRHPFSL